MASREKTIFDRLLAAGQRLVSVIQKCQGMANKDLSKFADQINALCDKWDRQNVITAYQSNKAKREGVGSQSHTTYMQHWDTQIPYLWAFQDIKTLTKR